MATSLRLLKSDKHTVSAKEYNIISLMQMSLMSELTKDSKPPSCIDTRSRYLLVLHDPWCSPFLFVPSCGTDTWEHPKQWPPLWDYWNQIHTVSAKEYNIISLMQNVTHEWTYQTLILLYSYSVQESSGITWSIMLFILFGPFKLDGYLRTFSSMVHRSETIASSVLFSTNNSANIYFHEMAVLVIPRSYL